MIALSCCPRPSSSLPANYTHVGSAAPCQIHNYPAFHWHQRHQVEVWKTKNQQDATTHLLGGSLTVQLALIFFGSFLLSFVVRGHKEVHWSWLVINCTLKSIFAFMDFWVSQAGWKMNSGLTGKFKDLIKKVSGPCDVCRRLSSRHYLRNIHYVHFAAVSHSAQWSLLMTGTCLWRTNTHIFINYMSRWEAESLRCRSTSFLLPL